MSGGLLPGGLAAQHEVGVVEEEKTDQDTANEDNKQTEEDENVGSEPV